MAAEEGSLIDLQAKGRKAGNAAKKSEKEKRIVELEDAFKILSDGGKPVPLEAMAQYFDVSQKTARRYVAQSENFAIGENKVYRK